MLKRADGRSWYQGPTFQYTVSPRKIQVDVTSSSWPIRGLALAKVVKAVLREANKNPRDNILDFGAGSWLRYSQYLQKAMRNRNLYAVEYAEAFTQEAPRLLKENLEDHLTLWRPSDFVKNTKTKFDLALLINVLNTIPEESHRVSILKTIAKRLNPRGWLVVYQRIWAARENPAGAREYKDGWIVPLKHRTVHTYRGKIGNRWFNEQSQRAGLSNVTTKTQITSANAIFRVWEKPF